MRAWTRVRAYAGLWTLVALLGGALVFVAAAAGPTGRQIEDRALRGVIAEGSTAARDITALEPTAAPATTARLMHDGLHALLPPPLADVLRDSWGFQRSRIERPTVNRPRQYVSLDGDGASTEPSGYLPLATLLHQTGLAGEVNLVEGAAPSNPPGGELIEVMAAPAVAEAMGLRIGQRYHLRLGEAAVFPAPVDGAAGPVVEIVLTGTFEARDPAAPGWQLGPLLAAGQRQWPVGAGVVAPLRHGTLVTDQPGIDNLRARGLEEFFGFESIALFRLDEQRLDAGWLPEGRAAVAQLQTSPELRPSVRVQTGLPGLFDEFTRQAVAARAVAAVVVAGIVGTGVGLLILAARLIADRRRGELSLLRARGASAAAVVGVLLAEAAVVALPAVVTGWSLALLMPGRPDPGPLPGFAAAPLAVAVVVLLVAPVAVGWEHRPRRRRATGSRGRSVAARRVRPRAGALRLTAEALVVLLAGFGVVLLHRRGVTGTAAGAGADPYLSAVPVLIGLAVGVLALRLYPWPLRLLGGLAARRRGAVGFLGLARGARSAPVSALPLLVLVLAVALGGFAAAVQSSIAAARDAGARQAVGADARLSTDTPGGGGLDEVLVRAVGEVPGVAAVAGASEQGFVRLGGGVDINVAVMIVDAPDYQRVLAELGWPRPLPPELVAAGPGNGPVPVLTWQPVDRELTLLIGGRELPAVSVGEVAGLPRLHTGRTWMLVPRQALAEPPPVDELLVGGRDLDLSRLRAAVAGEADRVELVTLAGRRAELADSGFNRGLSGLFVAGAAAAALGGLFAVGLALAAAAAVRGRTLSLLRTMGLSNRQARWLLLVEVLPLTTLAVVAGAVAGTAMPALLAPALGLAEFTGGTPVTAVVDTGTVGLLVGLLAAFVVGGVLMEVAVNRRLGLGAVLRV